MRFLVDEDLPRDVAVVLSRREHDVVYVPDSDLRSYADNTLWSLTAAEERILVTRDLDFPLTDRSAPRGLVLLRVPTDWHRREIANLFELCTERIEEEGMGKIVVITPSRIRVRSLA